MKPGTAAVFEHQLLSMFLKYGATVDRFNIKTLTSFELAARRLQLHESAVSECPEAPSYEGARHFVGIQDRRGGALVSPQLQAYAASELGKEAAVLKEKRKAREARATQGRKGASKGGCGVSGAEP